MRKRRLHLILIVITVTLGLAVRRFGHILPVFIAKYGGDTLWALMVFWAVGFILPKLSGVKVALLATVFSFAIELSQLYHSPWIDAIRHTTLGGLALGYGFLWSDLVCYTVGVIIGIIIEKGIDIKRGQTNKSYN